MQNKSEQSVYLTDKLTRLKSTVSKMNESDPLYKSYTDHIRQIEEFLGDNNGASIIKDMLTAKSELKPKYDLGKILGIEDKSTTGQSVMKNYINNGITISRVE